MRNDRNGFTLIELLIVVAIIAIIAAISIPAMARMSSGASHAKDELSKYAAELGWDLQGVSCAGTDSDGDGYISCTAAVRQNGTVVPHAVECASGYPLSFTSGCKIAMPKLVQ